MRTLALCLLLTALPALADSVWVEAERYGAADGDVLRLDRSAPDFGAMAQRDAGGEAFLRISPGAALTYPLDTTAGEYHVWVRAFAIDGRRVRVAVDGDDIGFSRGGPNTVALVWQLIGRVTLAAGAHTLTLAAADENAKPAYVDALLLTTEAGALPTGRDLSDVLSAGAPVAAFGEDWEAQPIDTRPGEPWRVSAEGDQWARVVAEDGRRCLRAHNGSGQALTVGPLVAVAPNAQRQVRVRFAARRYGITESLLVQLPGIGTWSPNLRRQWTAYERTFLVPAGHVGPVLAQLGFRGGGDTLIDDVVIDAPDPAISPFETGRFIGPAILAREGRLFEAERCVTNADAVSGIDTDGDGRWSFVRLSRDDNEPMFSRGTALKSDSANSPPLELVLRDLLPGPYSVWTCDPGRPLIFQVADREPVVAVGGRQTPLGRVEISDGTLRVSVRQGEAPADNPGPAYLDYLLLLPVENRAFTQRPAPSWAETAPDGAERAQVTFTLRRPGTAGGGVALPPGALGDAAHARVLSGGREVPAQTKALRRWPDGSIQWLFVVAGPLPAGEGVLEYGSAVRPAPLPQPAAPELRLEDGALWTSLRPAPAALGPLTAELVLDDGTLLRPRALRATVVEQGPVRTVIRVDGAYAAGERAPFGLELLVTLDADAVELEHTFIAKSERETERIRSLTLRLAAANDGVSCPEAGGARAAALRLVQDGDNPWARPDGAAWRLTLDGVETRGERAAGVVQAGELHLAVDDFAQQWPIALGGDAAGLTVELWPADAAEGAFAAHRGMAKTHVLRLGRGAAPAPSVDWLRFDPAALRASGALGPLAAPGAATAAYDALVDRALDEILDNRAGYGMENWGDMFQGGYVRGVKTWSNQEWDLVQSWLVAYARLGEPRYLDFADAAARHFADVDCIHAGPEAIVGGARTHVHTSAVGHQLEGPNLAHSGWVEGLLTHYYLTGRERSLRAALAIGDWTVRQCPPVDELTPGGPAYSLVQNRPAGWPLTTLCLLYQHAREPQYLEAARRIVDYMRRCQMPGRGCWEAQTPHEQPWRGGCVFAFTNFQGLKLYADITGEPEADADRAAAGRWLVGELWRPGDRYLYEQCPAHEPGTDVGFLQWGTLADLTELTGDPLYLMLAIDGYTARLGRPDQMVADMARSQWGNGTLQQAPRMLALAEHGLPERPAGVTLEAAGGAGPLTPGLAGEVVFSVRNGGTVPLTDIAVSALIRGDWAAEVAEAPSSLPPGAEVRVRVRATPPPAREVVEHDNAVAHMHLLVRGRAGGRDAALRGVAAVAVSPPAPPAPRGSAPGR